MINWRNIKTDGLPTNGNKKYLVTDGKDISTSGVEGITNYNGTTPIFTFKKWCGDDNTGEDNGCCSGTPYFDLTPTHWCPTDELNLPEN
jgi:hypothetical protein